MLLLLQTAIVFSVNQMVFCVAVSELQLASHNIPIFQHQLQLYKLWSYEMKNTSFDWDFTSHASFKKKKRITMCQ